MEHAIPMRLSRDIADISKGKNQSKWRVVWRFCFEGIPREHVITLTHSVLSGKKRIEHNGRPVFSSTGRVVGEFSHRMLLKDHRLGAVITSTNAYELFVDGRRFEELPEASFSMMDAWRREALPGSAATMASNGSTRSEAVTGRAGTATQIRSMDDEDEGQAFGFTDSYGEVGAGTPTGRAPAPGRAAAPRAAIAAATADDDAFGWGSGSGLEQSAGGPPAPGRTPSRAPGAAAARGRGTAVGGSGGRQRQPDPFDDDAGDAFSDGLDDGRAHRGVGGDADAFGEGVGEFADASGAGAAVDPFAEDVDDAPPNVAEEVSMLNFETDAPRAGGVGGGGGISAGGGGGGGSGGDGFDDDDLFGPAPAPAAGGGGGVGGLIASEVDDVFAAAPAGLGGGSASGGGDGGGGGGGADASSRRSEVDEATLVNLEDLTGVRRAEAARLAGRAPTKPTTMGQLRASRRPTGVGPAGPVMRPGPTPPGRPGLGAGPVAGALAFTAAGGAAAGPAPASAGHDPFRASPPRGGAGGMAPMRGAGGAGRMGGGGLDAVLRAEAAPRPRMAGRRPAASPAAKPKGGDIDIDPFA
ncbi:hypothetical protein FNF31_06809 [Cafeteria roenbergensis]|uniref:Uncharacterized protein n=1 Tax=Cafeteria roenbergensis TaxID=33653 RepID=A0A5A8CHP4_CAFRO|nr:hypothetical protein FNF31_06809 [Cafeteria roenbergensis]